MRHKLRWQKGLRQGMKREINAVNELAKRRRWQLVPEAKPYLARLFHDIRGEEAPREGDYGRQVRKLADGKRIIMVGNEGNGELKALGDMNFDVTGVRWGENREEQHVQLSPKSRLMWGDFNHLPIEPNSYDYVMMRDVLNEHGHPHDKKMVNDLLYSPTPSVRKMMEEYVYGGRQHKILDTAYPVLRPGGKLISLGHADHGHNLIDESKLRDKWHVEEAHEYEPNREQGEHREPWEAMHSFLVLKKKD